jgi:phosphotransacetylase
VPDGETLGEEMIQTDKEIIMKRGHSPVSISLERRSTYVLVDRTIVVRPNTKECAEIVKDITPFHVRPPIAETSDINKSYSSKI